jgi:hypothetical protein
MKVLNSILIVGVALAALYFHNESLNAWETGYNAAIEKFYREEKEIYSEDHKRFCIVPHGDIGTEKRCFDTDKVWESGAELVNPLHFEHSANGKFACVRATAKVCGNTCIPKHQRCRLRAAL